MKKNHQLYQSLQVLGKIGSRVIQRVAPGQGNIDSDPSGTLQDRAYVPHNTSNTPAQAARRSRFQSAALAWQTLDPATKQDYNVRANSRGITGYNLFISERMRYS